MYKKPNGQLSIYDFVLPFGGKLDPNNRWAKLAQLIPWDEVEKKYSELFSNPRIGNVAKPARMALGALIIKEKCGYSDEETVQQIQENPYLQYFIGLKEFQTKPPFDPSLMVHFRKRLKQADINDLNELIFSEKAKPDEDDNDEESDDDSGTSSGSNNKGKLFLDSSCAPADIRFPTDINLLNEARMKLEKIIDVLHEPFKGNVKKPRTYRQKARKDFLSIAKTSKPRGRKLRKGIGKQLRYINRNLKHIDKLLSRYSENPLGQRVQGQLEVIKLLYHQQKEMYDKKVNRIENRIVSISQPHIRPIVRGKVHNPTEFGAKIAVSLVNGYAFVDELSWDNFSDGKTLQSSIEKYRERFGVYPEVVIADQVYRTRENRKYCKERGIRVSGPRLGRPPLVENKVLKKLEQQEARERNWIEGKFGEGKRRYGLDRISARLKETSETVIALQFLVMNLERDLRILFAIFPKGLLRKYFKLKEQVFCFFEPKSIFEERVEIV